MKPGRAAGLLFGLGAAALFGMSVPVNKLLLGGAGVLALSACLYLGAGLAITGIRLVQRARAGPIGGRAEAALSARDLPALVTIVVLGGAVAPALMLLGLKGTSGVTGALLLNLEAPFTIALALAVFREHLGWLEGAAAVRTIAGAALLSVVPGPWRAEPFGLLTLAGACLCWAIDNNLSQRLSGKDPLEVVQIKTLGAGVVSALLAWALGERPPSPSIIVGALLLGTLSYGVSLLFDMRALRLLGAAREAAVFATAPFIGAALAVPLLGERPAFPHVLAAALMGGGVWLLFRVRHGHLHTHDPIEHEHLHEHDEHHRHEHPEGTQPERHSHPHRHDPVTHEHAHVSDAHHRHRHDCGTVL